MDTKYCQRCGNHFYDHVYNFACPKCGSLHTISLAPDLSRSKIETKEAKVLRSKMYRVKGD